MATIYSILVHADHESRITCQRLFSAANGTDTNTVKIDSLTIFAGPAELQRLADVITARLAVIAAAAEQVAA